MLIPFVVIFIVCAAIGLIVGQSPRNIVVLLGVALSCWPGALIATYFTGLVWRDRAYSENWAMLGFLFFTLPYAALAGIMALVELFLLREWPPMPYLEFTRNTAISLLILFALQLIVGAFTAK